MSISQAVYLNVTSSSSADKTLSRRWVLVIALLVPLLLMLVLILRQSDPLSDLEAAKVRLPQLFGAQQTGEHKEQSAAFNNIDGTPVPMWLYILLEADIEQKGQSLGTLGSQIFAEQFMWILRHEPTALMDKKQFQNYLETKWEYEMSLAGRSQAKAAATQLAEGVMSIVGEKFTMADLIAFPETVNNAITFPKNP